MCIRDRDFHWHLELAPYHREPGTLFLEFGAYRFPPSEVDDALREAIDQTQAFLDDNVTNFVMKVLA